MKYVRMSLEMAQFDIGTPAGRIIINCLKSKDFFLIWPRPSVGMNPAFLAAVNGGESYSDALYKKLSNSYSSRGSCEL
jgi:hypothetical protein